MTAIFQALPLMQGVVSLNPDAPGLRAWGGSAVGRQRLPNEAVGQAVLTFTGLQPGTDVVVLRAGTDDALLDLNETAGSSYAYTYSLFSAPTVVDIAFYKAGFVPHTSIRNFTLPSTNAVLPISQVADRNYRNPI